MLLKIAIFLYTFLFVLAVFVKRRNLREKIGHDPIISGQEIPPLETYLKKGQGIFFILWLGGLNLYSFFPHLFGPIPTLAIPPFFRLVGVVLLYVALVIFFVSLIHLREAWRVGIDRLSTGPLITHGIYKQIRHPIYTSIKIAQGGTILIFPNLYFILIGLMGSIGATLLALTEEQFLTQKFGQAYKDYSLKTGRFYPKI